LEWNKSGYFFKNLLGIKYLYILGLKIFNVNLNKPGSFFKNFPGIRYLYTLGLKTFNVNLFYFM
jgi:hypothetical protein